ncbi:hypothetical protein [Conservatibacter flavescens]|uniref:Uncharacterized protein n=1 Tax=Conservatibacter flavescens TaxID=28161 RepID=A0A2M8S4B6_9PAST|nr:hypothetical protein [Conservatibacter flavescens]PJG85967.1 hypothetical protein CVP05_02000 [Conservatibacter flavescens]
MKKSYFKIIAVIYITLIYSYIFFGGVAKRDLVIQEDTKQVYDALTKEIISMKGEYRQYGGQVIHGFILEISFKNSMDYNEERVFKKIESLGFYLQNVEKNKFYLFCEKNKEHNRGFLVAKESRLKIMYENSMIDCVN